MNECGLARKASKNQDGCIKGGRVEHNAGQGRDGKGETERLVLATEQQRRMNEMAHDRMEGWARGKAWRGGGHGKGAEHVEGQVKWQNRADRRTQKESESEGHVPGRGGRQGLRAGQDRTGQGMVW